MFNAFFVVMVSISHKFDNKHMSQSNKNKEAFRIAYTPTRCISYLRLLPNWSTNVIAFFTLSTIPGKLVSSLLEATSSAEGKSTYKIFVLAGNSSCKLNKG